MIIIGTFVAMIIIIIIVVYILLQSTASSENVDLSLSQTSETGVKPAEEVCCKR